MPSRLSGDFERRFEEILRRLSDGEEAVIGDITRSSELTEAVLGDGLGGGIDLTPSSRTSALDLESRFESRLSGDTAGFLSLASNSSKTSEFLDSLLEDFLRMGMGLDTTTGLLVSSGVVGVSTTDSAGGKVPSRLSRVSIDISEMLSIRGSPFVLVVLLRLPLLVFRLELLLEVGVARRGGRRFLGRTEIR